MNESGKSNLQTQILNTIARLEKENISLKEQSKPIPPSVALGRLSRMDAFQQKNMAEANLRSNNAMLLKLKDTLLRLHEPDFGVCVKCKKNIPTERILLVPESRICVQCISKIKR